MKRHVTQQTLALVASQLEAASGLIKFAVDDLRDLFGEKNTQFLEEMRIVLASLDAQSSALDGHAAFFIRIGEDVEEPTTQPELTGMRETAS